MKARSLKTRFLTFQLTAHDEAIFHDLSELKGLPEPRPKAL